MSSEWPQDSSRGDRVRPGVGLLSLGGKTRFPLRKNVSVPSSFQLKGNQPWFSTIRRGGLVNLKKRGSESTIYWLSLGTTLSASAGEPWMMSLLFPFETRWYISPYCSPDMENYRCQEADSSSDARFLFSARKTTAVRTMYVRQMTASRLRVGLRKLFSTHN